jgi:disulfide bond formation protein DsbB
MKEKPAVWFLVMIILLVGLVACGGDSSDTETVATDEETAVVSTGDPEAGKAQYDQICIACHGSGGEGIEGLGKPFTTSEFLREKNDAEMLEFIKTGRPSGDPLNTTGVDMPPKGGNPALSDEQILDIIAYIRTLH